VHERAGDLQAENCAVGFFGGEQSAHYSHERVIFNKWTGRGGRRGVSVSLKGKEEKYRRGLFSSVRTLQCFSYIQCAVKEGVER